MQNICGNKQQRMDQIDVDIENQTVATITQWPGFRDKMSDLLRKRNLIPGLQDNEKESDSKQLRQFCAPLNVLFATFYENYVLDAMKPAPQITLATAITLYDALYHA